MRLIRLSALLVAILSVAANAQSARVSGVVRSVADAPLGDAQVYLPALGIAATSADDGTFAFAQLPAGTYDLKVYRIGFKPASVSGIVAREGNAAPVTIRLEPTTVQLPGAVISVSRRAESAIDAPASVTRFAAAPIDNTLGSAVTNLLKDAPGVDLTQVGVMSSFVNGRGFNRVFNARWLTLEDGRVAAFAETGLPIGEHSPIPKVDIGSLEVISGPGSALYGANASAGVLSLVSKDPREHPGFTAELYGGSRGYYDAQFRYAGVSGRWGYKLAAQAHGAEDWSDTLFYPAITPTGQPVRESAFDHRTRARRASGSLRYYAGDDARIELNVGTSLRDGIGQSAQGRYHIKGYEYADYQLVARNARWIAQVYETNSSSGDTYRLNFYSQALARPGVSNDSALAIAAFPVQGRIQAAEVQHNLMLGAHARTGVDAIDNTRATFGVQVRRDRVTSDRKLYTDVATGKPIIFDARAFYLQLESPLTRALRFVGAVRFDDHNRFDSRWSPKLGLVYDLAPAQVVRFTVNQAYYAPTILQSDVYAYNPAARLITIGNNDGFEVRNSAGTVLSTISSIGPETNVTWEVGYKGVVGDKLYADVTLYRSEFRDFMTLAGPINNPFVPGAQTFAFNRRTGQRINDPSGAPLITYTFINVGRGRFDGLDASLRYQLTDRVALASATTLSWVGDIEKKPTDPPEASAFNTSAVRSTLAVEVTDRTEAFKASLRTRHVAGYDFRSGADWGRIPTHTTLGASASYTLRSSRTTFLLQADNVMTCVGGTTTPPAAGISPTTMAVYRAGQECGMGIRHHEMLNMPAVGTVLMIGVRRVWE